MRPHDKPGCMSIIVVDDEEIVRHSMKEWLEEDGHTVRACAGAAEALSDFQAGQYSLALVDIKMPGMDGLELSRRLRAADSDIAVVVMTAFASVDTAVQALKDGAYDYITKPFDPDVLSHLIRKAAQRRDLVRENRGLRNKIKQIAKPRPILGDSPATRRVVQLVETVAPTDASVLITGESGVGKELVARAVHSSSPRALMPLVVVNCGALPEGTLESELFGHERGAFTGARFRHKGKFELADGGTLFLDEIGEVTQKIQVEMLRVLEEKRIVRMGGTQSVSADFRIVAATNRDLKAEVRSGRFREDLFYRLNVFHINVPPLRERKQDVVPLALHFAQHFARQMNRPVPAFEAAALDRLQTWDWPGNVRELANAIERAMVVQRENMIRSSDLPIEVEARSIVTTGTTLAAVERSHIAGILDACEWNISEAARQLGVDRGTVYNKIKQYALRREGGVEDLVSDSDR